MEKKESPKKPPVRTQESSKPQGPPAGLSAKAFGIIKFILGISLLPFVYAVSKSFILEFALIENKLQGYFWLGVAGFIIIHLLIFEPAIIYRKGHRMLEIVFSFFAPLVKVAPYVLPIYTVIIFIAYLLLSVVTKSGGLLGPSMFLIGFSITLHLVFSAKTVRSKQGDFLKANYIFGFSFIYIVNVLLLSLCFSVIFKNFSFIELFKNSYQLARGLFYSIFSQLFL